MPGLSGMRTPDPRRGAAEGCPRPGARLRAPQKRVGYGTSMNLRVAHSPDSDDAFMFYALSTGKIPTGDLRYEHVLKDIRR